MTAKEYLNQIHNAEKGIKELQDEIHTLEALATSTTVSGQSEKVLSSGTKEKMADTVVLIDEKVSELQDKTQALIKLRTEVMMIISKVCDMDYQQILYKRYCQSKKFEEIAVEMTYSWRWVIKLHGRALDEIDKIINRTC